MAKKTTIAGELQVGDRFYKQGDAKKVVSQVHALSLTHIIAIKPDVSPEFQERTSKKIKNTIPVIFLRNVFEEEGGE